MGRFTQKGDRRGPISNETRKKLSRRLSHGGYRELERWKAGKGPDKRTAFGQHIAKIEENIIADLGGQDSLTQKQRILLDRVIEKLVFLERVGAYSMSAERIVTNKGELIPALGKSYIAFSNALRRDLETLYDGAYQTQGRLPTLDEWITAEEGKKK